MINNKIKALILVGGYGSRLRPLTHTIPKPLIPFVNMPILERQIKSLSKVGIKDIVLAMNYKYSIIEKQTKPLEKKYQVNIIFSLEHEPLGTAGPIAFAKKYLEDSYVFVLNSDVICEYPFEEMMSYHFKTNKLGTLLVTKVEEPSKFGVIKTNKFNEIEYFAEKPVEYISNLINAGIYFFSPEIFNYLREVPSSIEKEVFPLLAEERMLNVVHLNGYWSDIGTPQGYLLGQKYFLESDKSLGSKLFHSRDNVVIGNNVSIGMNVSLKNCTIFDNTVICNNVVINDSIIGSNCFIGEDTILLNYSILGDDSKILNKK
ncbi:hypothetical protein H312_01667 [Anncaliia algerae PRA339]|uniref:mannose-1-phosphate guanylyltransferase n=1 Tax=Anncaliia algerae PRA339 TaxID=1288291 RepID=A0A059F1K9_9MICR|nr:hypothetical protein H312_01667 [Anncaliia algerae PRA339]